ncbi:50S ribosomal protein L11 methyltransferase [Celeribacter indicus]|uniref:Ribosomal protein L11 methyltransferase n=1 Tax=Celeribacter indicus TaxID=1208324 RepID=A0A0B5DQU5_9RHOB|nr:50S ribosomal protein L11 methyltransferase [Celeribacter indicus]AJE45898.1 50S ribosomal protein L11 methyltransferase [Celeribacter indicus]SDW63267.1 [LSU ribosomal protein L11P]-lysine N-methyltransferase [Celeribacter indicus]
MPTFTAFTKTAGKAPAEALGVALEDLWPEPTGVGVFEIEDGSGLWEVGAYFTEAPDEIALALLARAHDAPDFVISELPETDWVAKVRRDLAPVEAGRFFVYGSHDADRLPEGRVGLLIEAAMAFGTGHHGTTLGCLTAFDRLLSDGRRFGNVADIGCGTAVLAMAAAKLSEEPVHASDIDEVAVEVAQSNVAANGLAGRVICLEAAGFDHPVLHEKAPFDLVFANILKGPLVALAPDMARHVAPGGHAILSGILTPQADEVVEVYTRAGFNLLDRQEIVDWTTLTFTRIDENQE